MPKFSYPRSLVFRGYDAIRIEDSLPLISVVLAPIWLTLLETLSGDEKIRAFSPGLKTLIIVFWVIGSLALVTLAIRRRCLVINLVGGSYKFTKFFLLKKCSIHGNARDLIGPEIIKHEFDEITRDVLFIAVPNSEGESFVLATSSKKVRLLAAQEKWTTDLNSNSAG